MGPGDYGLKSPLEDLKIQMFVDSILLLVISPSLGFRDRTWRVESGTVDRNVVCASCSVSHKLVSVRAGPAISRSNPHSKQDSAKKDNVFRIYLEQFRLGGYTSI
jgi:hypothetical protein